MNAPAVLRRLIGPALLVLGWILTATPAGAQQVFRGQVLDYDTNKPIIDAEVTLLSAGSLKIGTMRTDSEGVFALRAPGPGSFKIQSLRIGYKPSISPVLRIGRDTTIVVQMEMSPNATVLAPLAIVGKTANRLGDPLDPMWGYSFRKNMGLGTFIEYPRIMDQNPVHFVDILRTVPGVQSISGSDSVYFPRMANTRPDGELCMPGYFLDGFPMHDENPLETLSLLLPDGIEAIEIYKSDLVVPGEFAGSYSNCGAIIVWRKR